MKALEALNKVAHDVDPRPRRNSELDEHRFSEVVDAFVRLHCERHNRAVTRRDTERILKYRFVSKWKRRGIKTITKADVLEVLDRIMQEGLPSAANHALAAIRKFFNWCLERGLVELSPVSGIKKPAKEGSCDRTLDAREIASIWQASSKLGYPGAQIVRLLMLTAQRRSEVANMRWTHLDFNERSWSLPIEFTKNGRPHVVPLSKEAIAVLKSVPKVSDELVFPARGTDGKCFSDFSRMKRELDRASGVVNWTLHDLRRTAATNLARMEVPPHVVERILNHVTGKLGGVAGIYNRFEYLSERRAALEAWGGYVDRLGGGSSPRPVATCRDMTRTADRIC